MDRDERRHVVILSEGAGFPRGMAGSRRIELLARGLAENGWTVTVLVLRPFERPLAPLNTAPRGCHRGVHFEYPCGTTIRSRRFLARRWNDLRGITGAFQRLHRFNRAGALDAVILYSFNIRLVRLFSRACHGLGVPLIQELCEWPLDQLAAHGRAFRGAAAFCARVFGLVDAVLPISERIEQITISAGQRAGRILPCLRVPILVDPALFSPAAGTAPPPGHTIVYSGSAGYENILRLVLDACVELHRRDIQYQLKCTGYAGDLEAKLFREEVGRRGLAHHATHLGYLDDAELIELYRHAGVLLVPLPDDPQSRSRFPTRLGECLAVGRPVLTTGIGEAARWLRDRETAFLAPDCRPETLANAIVEIFADPVLSTRVGEAGRRLAGTEFNYRLHGRRLGEFLKTLQVFK